MIICVCRRISDKDIEAHVGANPQALCQEWKDVSAAISNQPPRCKEGKGHCTEMGAALLKDIAVRTVTPA